MVLIGGQFWMGVGNFRITDSSGPIFVNMLVQPCFMDQARSWHVVHIAFVVPFVFGRGQRASKVSRV